MNARLFVTFLIVAKWTLAFQYLKITTYEGYVFGYVLFELTLTTFLTDGEKIIYTVTSDWHYFSSVRVNILVALGQRRYRYDVASSCGNRILTKYKQQYTISLICFSDSYFVLNSPLHALFHPLCL